MAIKIAVATFVGLQTPISVAGDGKRPATCEAGGDATCSSPASPLSKDQALLQLNGEKAVTQRRAAASVESACTESGSDPWSTGIEVACCLGAHMELGPWSGGGPWSYLCRPAPVPTPPTPAPIGVVGYPSTGTVKAKNLWCEVDIPPATWNLKSCPTSGTTQLKVLSYNLFWWNLFDRHGGSDRSAGRLIARTGHYDLMGFQECDDRWRVLRDAGLNSAEYDAIDGGRAIAIAYRKTAWTLLSHGSVDVGEDSRDQYYGKRSAMWVRVRNAEGKIVFFMNHHGPLKVSQGGGCTGSATALNIMKVIANNAHHGDVIIVVGDFNAALGSSRVHELEKRLNKVHSGYIFGGVDHVFSNCVGHGTTHSKGDGYWKSDHNAVSANFNI